MLNAALIVLAFIVSSIFGAEVTWFALMWWHRRKWTDEQLLADDYYYEINK